MKTVKVKKDQLRETLLENKETHVKDFELAWEKYHERVIHNVEQLLQHAKDVKKGEPVNVHIGLQAPVNHEEDYERALEMLEWEVGDHVELTQAEFQQLVQDDWSWKQHFSSLNMAYTGSASPSKLALATSSRR